MVLPSAPSLEFWRVLLVDTAFCFVPVSRSAARVRLAARRVQACRRDFLIKYSLSFVKYLLADALISKSCAVRYSKTRMATEGAPLLAFAAFGATLVFACPESLLDSSLDVWTRFVRTHSRKADGIRPVRFFSPLLCLHLAAAIADLCLSFEEHSSPTRTRRPLANKTILLRIV